MDLDAVQNDIPHLLDGGRDHPRDGRDLPIKTGRRFQVVGANPTASSIAGLRVNLNQVMAYVVAAILYGIAGILLASFLRTIGGASARRTCWARSPRW